MSKRFPWIHSRKRSAPDLPVETPLWLGNQSNGEYFRTAKPRERLLHRAILEKADENARRLGMDRRDFLASSMGMCTTLWMMNHVAGCSSSDGSSGNGSSDGGGGSGGGGRDG
ncbi:MAG: hypothetical protein FJ104_16090, partial [Deltaproteobacteria bacterium]|nr:hypothetical protein [Deltaproteobacteria bacterium]